MLNTALKEAFPRPLDLPLLFPREEFAGRLQRTQAELSKRKLPGLLLFSPHSLYYLFGYKILHAANVYQLVVLPAEGKPIAIVRALDHPILSASAFGGEIRGWADVENPVQVTLDVLGEMGLLGRGNLGVEAMHQSLYPFWYDRLREGLADKGTKFQLADDIVIEQRIRKSPGEVELMKRAGGYLDVTFEAAFGAIRAGAKECEVNAEALYAANRAGADENVFPYQISSGRNTLSFTHLAATKKVIAAGDPVLMEAGASAESYYATGIHTVACGRSASEEMRTLYGQARRIVQAARSAIGPGVPVAEVARAMIAAGRGTFPGEFIRRFHGGYGIGIGFPSMWQDSLMIAERDTHVLAPGVTMMIIGVNVCADRYMVMTADPVVITKDGFDDLSSLNGDEMRAAG